MARLAHLQSSSACILGCHHHSCLLQSTLCRLKCHLQHFCIKNEGGVLHTLPDLGWPRYHRARHGICPTPPDHALCSRRVRAPSIQRGCERAPSREVVNVGGCSAIRDPAAEWRHPGRAPAAIGVVSPRTACPKTLSGPSIRAHRRIGGASGCGARGPTASGNSFGG